MIIGRLSSLETLLFQKINSFLASAQWNSFAVATKTLLSPIFSYMLSYLVGTFETGPCCFEIHPIFA